MELVTLEEAALRLRISRATLYRWSREGRIALYKLGPRATRVRAEDLLRLETEAVPLHGSIDADDSELWRATREQDLNKSLRAWEADGPDSDLRAFHREIAQMGTPVRWNGDLAEFEVSEFEA